LRDTCFRPASLALRAAGVVYVRRAFANGRLKKTKTRLSTRAVPLQAIALEALDRLPDLGEPASLAELTWRIHRLPRLRAGPLETRAKSPPASSRSATSTTCATAPWTLGGRRH
jgi:hypothetical protein